MSEDSERSGSGDSSGSSPAESDANHASSQNPASHEERPGQLAKKRKFTRRVGATSLQEYNKQRMWMGDTDWIVGSVLNMPDPVYIAPKDLCISEPTMLRDVATWLTNSVRAVPNQNQVVQILFDLLKNNMQTTFNMLSPECRLHLQSEEALPNWIGSKRANTTWKNRILGRFATERNRLSTLFAEECMVLEQLVNKALFAAIACNEMLKQSTHQSLPGIQISSRLKQLTAIGFSSYVSTPMAFNIVDEFTETVLQNQLHYYQSNPNVVAPESWAPVELPAAPEELIAAAAASLTELRATLELGFELYSSCKKSIPLDIVKAPPGQTTTHTAIRAWIKSHATPKYTFLKFSFNAHTQTVSRILNAVGEHFNIPVAGKHPLAIQFRDPRFQIGKRQRRKKATLEDTIAELREKLAAAEALRQQQAAEEQEEEEPVTLKRKAPEQ